MELASLAGADVAGDLRRSIAAVSGVVGDADDLHRELAQRHGVHVLAASAPVLTPDGPVNRARFFSPKGTMGVQDKVIMTRFERERWGIGASGPLRVFETELGRIGVLICYDCEFPLLARALVEAGAEILLVPSCTDGEAGYMRVRIAAMARALEGQCITVQAPTVGLARWSPAVDENVGKAGLFAPPDAGFPASGVLAEGEAMNVPGWVRANVDLAAVGQVRRDGQVLNHAHWQEQAGQCAVERLVL